MNRSPKAERLAVNDHRAGCDEYAEERGYNPAGRADRPRRDVCVRHPAAADTPVPEDIGSTYADSEADVISVPSPPAGAPNVVVVLLDDVGFGQAGTFGGPADTPTLQRLADEGLRYNRFHTTALCSPTRAALLSGRNHHSVHTGVITEMATGFPGYDGSWPREAACIAEVLKGNQYSTAAFGKWHNTPDHELGAPGPFDRWPVGKGFDYFFGFQGGESSQWHTPLYENTAPVEPPHDDPTWHFSEAIADKAIGWISQQKAAAPDKPFFLYFAPGACHSPHHVAKEWADKYRGTFDHGWDRQREITLENQKKLGVVPQDTKLTPRPDSIPAWDSCSPDEKRLFARMQEVFAPVRRPRRDRGRRGARAARSSRTSAPRYHARDVARRARAQRAGAVCVLGSATPSLETWHARAATARYRALRAAARAIGGGALPRSRSSTCATSRRERRGRCCSRARCSRRSRARSRRGEQTILFLNRRGFAPVLWCRGCGDDVRCAHCDVALTFHRRSRRAALPLLRLRGARAATPARPAARRDLQHSGAGTRAARGRARGARFPSARVARMDSRHDARGARTTRRALARVRARARSTCWSARR